jgi:hypothetical protein
VHAPAALAAAVADPSTGTDPCWDQHQDASHHPATETAGVAPACLCPLGPCFDWGPARPCPPAATFCHLGLGLHLQGGAQCEVGPWAVHWCPQGLVVGQVEPGPWGTHTRHQGQAVGQGGLEDCPSAEVRSGACQPGREGLPGVGAVAGACRTMHAFLALSVASCCRPLGVRQAHQADADVHPMLGLVLAGCHAQRHAEGHEKGRGAAGAAH